MVYYEERGDAIVSERNEEGNDKHTRKTNTPFTASSRKANADDILEEPWSSNELE